MATLREIKARLVQEHNGEMGSYAMHMMYLGAFAALGVTNVAMARELADLTVTDDDFEGAIIRLREAREGDRVWPALDWLRQRRAGETDPLSLHWPVERLNSEPLGPKIEQLVAMGIMYVEDAGNGWRRIGLTQRGMLAQLSRAAPGTEVRAHLANGQIVYDKVNVETSVDESSGRTAYRVTPSPSKGSP